MTPRDLLNDVLAAHGAVWSDEDRELAARVATRAAALGVHDVSGLFTGMVSMQPEFAHLISQLTGLSAAVKTSAPAVISDVLSRIFTLAKDAALKGLGLGGLL